MFGDQLLGLLLCAPCLALSELDGPWSLVEELAPFPNPHSGPATACTRPGPGQPTGG